MKKIQLLVWSFIFLGACSSDENRVSTCVSTQSSDDCQRRIISVGSEVLFSDVPTIEKAYFDGTIKTLASDSTYLYVGGEFTNVGFFTGHGFSFKASTKRFSSGIDKKAIRKSDGTGAIYFALQDDTGGFYVGGDFDRVGDETGFSNLAYISNSRNVNKDWKPELNGVVRALHFKDSKIYVGGEFTDVEGNPGNDYLISYTLETDGDLVLDDTWSPGLPTNTTKVSVFAENGNVLYVGGDFTSVGGWSGLATFNFPTATADDPTAKTWDTDINEEVLTLLVQGSKLYVGGSFTNLGTRAQNYLASFSFPTTATNNPTLDSWDPQIGSGSDFQVEALAASSSTLYVGGKFEEIGASGSEEDRKALASFTLSANEDPDLTDWEVSVLKEVGGSDVTGSVKSLLLHGSEFYAGGDFEKIKIGSEDDEDRMNLASFNGEDLSSWEPHVRGEVFVLSKPSSGRNEIFLGGAFQALGSLDVNNLVAFALSDRNLVSTWKPELNGVVEKLLVVGDRLYLGGAFTKVDDDVRLRLASFDLEGRDLPSLSNWDVEAKDSTLDTETGSTEVVVKADIFVQSLYWSEDEAGEENDNKLYIAGKFDSLKGEDVKGLAVIENVEGLESNADTVTAIADGFLLGSSGSDLAQIYDMIVTDSYLYAVGNFHRVKELNDEDNEERIFMASFDLSDYSLTSRKIWEDEAAREVDKIKELRAVSFKEGLFYFAGTCDSDSGSNTSCPGLIASSWQGSEMRPFSFEFPTDVTEIGVWDILNFRDNWYAGGNFKLGTDPVIKHFLSFEEESLFGIPRVDNPIEVIDPVVDLHIVGSNIYVAHPQRISRD